MRAIVNTGRNRLEMLELPKPEPGPGQVRIRTGAVGICATDLQMIAGWERTGFPAIPGHEWSGTVDAVGEGVRASLTGERCVAENVLSDGGEVGFEHPGGYAEYLITEAANLQVAPKSASFALLVLAEPLAVSVRALGRLGTLAPGAVLVFGDGPIGLILVLLLARQGREVVAVGGRKCRLDLAKSIGAEQALDYHEFSADLVCGVRSRAGRDYAAVVEASGSGRAMDAAMGLVAREGKVLLVGDYGGAYPTIPWNLVLWSEISLIGSNASAGAWPEAMRLLTEEQLPLERLVTHQFDADRFSEAFDTMRDRNSGAVKVVLTWQ